MLGFLPENLTCRKAKLVMWQKDNLAYFCPDTLNSVSMLLAFFSHIGTGGEKCVTFQWVSIELSKSVL